MPTLKSVGCQCPGCNPEDPCLPQVPEQPTLECEVAEVVLFKEGYPENPGYESSPPKIYRNRSCNGYVDEYVYEGDACSGPPTVTSNPCDEEIPPPCAGVECVPTITGNQITYVGDGGCYSQYPAHKYLGTITVTLSYEYLTSELVSLAQSALASAGYSSGGCSAVRDLSEDETSIALSKVRYRFALPDLTGYSCYMIEHDQGVYVWDGTATHTPWYYVDPPEDNGLVTVGEGTASCDGC
jgi:hypothetical protein